LVSVANPDENEVGKQEHRLLFLFFADSWTFCARTYIISFE